MNGAALICSWRTIQLWVLSFLHCYGWRFCSSWTSWKFLPLNMKALRSFGTMGIAYPVMQCHIPEKWYHQINSCVYYCAGKTLIHHLLCYSITFCSTTQTEWCQPVPERGRRWHRHRGLMSSRMSGNNNKVTCHNSWDMDLQKHCCGNLKPHKGKIFFPKQRMAWNPQLWFTYYLPVQNHCPWCTFRLSENYLDFPKDRWWNSGWWWQFPR